MTSSTIHQVMAVLGTKRSAFWSEADFQFAFAWELQKQQPQARVYLERRDAVHKYHVDIWVEKNGKMFPVELKYKNKAATIGDVTLLNQSATDFGCYDYLKDIHRIEDLAISEPNFGKGFAVLLTNDPAYYNNTGRLSAYDEFKVYAGAIRTGSLQWGHTAKGLPFSYGNRPPFVLRGVYNMSWYPYNNTAHDFQYLLNEV